MLGFLRLAYLHPPLPRLPRIDRVLRYAHFPRHILCLAPRLQLLQRPNHLRLRVPALGHAPPPFPSPKSSSISCGLRGAGQSLLFEECCSGFTLLLGQLTSVRMLPVLGRGVSRTSVVPQVRVLCISGPHVRCSCTDSSTD